MSPLDKKRLQVDLLQIQAGKASLELQIEMKKEEIERMKAHLIVSEEKELEIMTKIEGNK